MKRKLMAFSLAMAMTVSSASMAFGATPTIKGSAGTPLAAGVSSEEVIGNATIDYVDKDITIVDLPTAKPDFVLDPQGLYGAINDANYGTGSGKKDVNELASTYAGKVVGKDVLQITNRGANKIKVDATFVATSTATDDATKPSFVATAGDVKEDTEDNTINLEVALATALVKGDVASPATTANGEPVFVKKASSPAPADKTETPFSASSTGKTAFTDAGKVVSFVLDGDGTYGYKDDTSGGGHKFSYDAGQIVGGGTTTKGNKSPVAQALYISGTMNKNADWSKYAGADPANKVGVKVIYSVAKATSADTTSDTSGFIAATDIAGGKVTATGSATSATITFTKSAISNATLADYIKINNVVLSNDSNWSRGVLGSVNSATGTITLTTRGLTAAGITGTGNYDVEVKDSEGNPYTCKLAVA